MARMKRWSDAKEFYTKAIGVLAQKGRGTQAGEADGDVGEHVEDEADRLREVEEACYGNRALCNLELSMRRRGSIPAMQH